MTRQASNSASASNALSSESAVAARPITKTPRLVAAMPHANSAFFSPMRGAANTATAWHHAAAARTDGKRNANSLVPKTRTDTACSQ